MNELIEFVWKHCEHPLIKEEFAQAIETACEAQRNACVRDFNNYAQRHEYSNNCARVILKAKIERQDYE